jgi:hypothetical protein
MRSSFFLLALTALQHLAWTVQASSLVVHERRALPHLSKFRLHKRASGDQIVPLRIYLKQNNLDQLDKFLYEVSDPSSRSYGKHWSPEEVKSTFMPSAEAHESVMQWLQEELDSPRISAAPSGSHLTVSLPIAEAERLLGAKYYVFQHIDGTEHVGKDLVALVTLPTNQFMVQPARSIRFLLTCKSTSILSPQVSHWCPGPAYPSALQTHSRPRSQTSSLDRLNSCLCEAMLPSLLLEISQVATRLSLPTVYELCTTSTMKPNILARTRLR